VTPNPPAHPWLSTLDKTGWVMKSWRVKPQEFPQWIGQRLRGQGITAQREAVELLAKRNEGNLFAAAQEIEKLKLLVGDQPLTKQIVMKSVAPSQRYSIYDLADATLAGNPQRIHTLLSTLYQTGADPILLLWAVMKDVRTLEKILSLEARGMSPGQALQNAGVWSSRQPVFTHAKKRLSPQRIARVIEQGARVDKILKGAAQGDPFDELLQLCILLSTAKEIHYA